MSTAGWYPDPENTLQQRFWDGTAWTGSTRSAANLSDTVSRLASVTRSTGQHGPNNAAEHTPVASPNYVQVPSALQTVSSKTSAGWIVFWIVLALIVFGSCSAGGSGRYNDWQMGVDGDGYRVTCEDGTTSLSGGKPGACSHHGGVR